MVDVRIIVAAPAMVIALLAMLPVINTLGAALETTLASATSVYYTNLIMLLIGSIGLIMVLGIVWHVWNSTQAPFPDTGGRMM
jgi:hypothetical protein